MTLNGIIAVILRYYTTPCPEKVPLYFCLLLRKILTDFQNSFTITLCSKFSVR